MSIDMLRRRYRDDPCPGTSNMRHRPAVLGDLLLLLAMEVSPDTEWGSVLTLLSSGAGQVLVSFDITPEVRQGRGDERLIGRAQARSR